MKIRTAMKCHLPIGCSFKRGSESLVATARDVGVKRFLIISELLKDYGFVP